MAIDGVRSNRPGPSPSNLDAALWQQPEVLSALVAHLGRQGFEISVDELARRIEASPEAQNILLETASGRPSTNGAGPVAASTQTETDLAKRNRALEYYNRLMAQMAALEEAERAKRIETAEARYAGRKSAEAIANAGKPARSSTVAPPNTEDNQSLEGMLKAVLGITSGASAKGG